MQNVLFTPAGGAALPQQHRAADRAVHSGKPGRDHHPYHPGSGAALLLLPFQRGAHLPGDRLSGLQRTAPRPDAGACHPWRERQPPGKGHHPAGQPAGDRGQGDPQEHPEPAGHPAAAFAGRAGAVRGADRQRPHGTVVRHRFLAVRGKGHLPEIPAAGQALRGQRGLPLAAFAGTQRHCAGCGHRVLLLRADHGDDPVHQGDGRRAAHRSSR